MCTLLKTIHELENSEAKMNESDIHGKLDSLDASSFSEDEKTLFKNELIAFALQEQYDWSKLTINWGTYFGPHCVLVNKNDKSVRMIPDVSEISTNTIKYWEDRFHKTPSLVFKIRYGMLLCDLSKKVTDASCSIEVAHQLIDSLVQVNKCTYPNETDHIQKIEAALNISLRFNHRVADVKGVILNYDENVAGNSGVYDARLLAFKLLLRGSKKKVQLSADEENEVVSRLQERFDALCDQAGRFAALFLSKEIAACLAKYYQGKNNQHPKISAVVEKYLDSLLNTICLRHPLQNQSLLKDAYELAKEQNLQRVMEKIALKLQEVGLSARKDMKIISVEVPVDMDKVNNYINAMTEGDLAQCLKRCAISCISSKSSVESELKDLAKSCPMTYTIPISITDPMGRQVATLSPLRDDLEGHIYHHAGKKIMLEIGSGVLRKIIECVFKEHKVNVEKLLDHLYRSPLFLSDRKDIIKSGLAAYVENKPIDAIHLLVPQIEGAIRQILTLHNQPVYKTNKSDGFDLKVLDKILDEKIVESTLGADVAFHFRVLFTSQRGLNLRNDICHGLSLDKTFTMEIADLVFCALLRLSEVEATEKSN